jgi:hypothetical protein
MKYTFICEETSGTGWKNSVQFQVSQIDDLIQNFKYFLKGCSYDSDLVESRFVDEDTELELNLQELFPGEDNSEAVMKFTVNSLSSWPKNVNNEPVLVDCCPKCNIPMNLIYRHGCSEAACKHIT